jgi:phospholipid/cholesterol/gamma-HCH transport system substrate-binding protein
MPRTRSILWSQLKLGIVGVVTLALAITLILAVGGQAGFAWERHPLKVRFDTVSGLTTGAVVRLNGMEVGQVTNVEFAGAAIDVTMEITEDVRHLVTTDSVASVGSLSLLGDPIVDLTAATTGTPIPAWGYVASGAGSGPLSGLQAASAGLETATQLLSDIRAGRGTIGQLVTNDALYRDLNQLVQSATEVTSALNRGDGTMGQLMRDPAAYDALRGSLQNLEDATARLRTGQGTLGRLLHDEAMGQSLSSTVSGLQDVTARMQRGEGTVGQLLTDRQLYDRFTQVGTRLDTLVANLEAGQGTAGQLLRDRQLYENMNRAVTELRDLFSDIRKDPKKFLTIRVSIF